MLYTISQATCFYLYNCHAFRKILNALNTLTNVEFVRHLVTPVVWLLFVEIVLGTQSRGLTMWAIGHLDVPISVCYKSDYDRSGKRNKIN